MSRSRYLGERTGKTTVSFSDGIIRGRERGKNMWCKIHGDLSASHVRSVCGACYDVLERDLAECRAKLAEATRLADAGIKTAYEVEEILGMALYGKSEEGLPLWGEHIPQTLATEAIKRMERLREALRKWWNYGISLTLDGKLFDEAMDATRQALAGEEE